jgi:integral membrane protein
VAAEPSSTVAARAAAVSPARLAGALRRFQVAAYVVGVFLLLLVTGMGFKYLGEQPRMVEIVGPIHGFIYAVYLAIALDLALRAKWSIRGTLLVLLAGTIPFLSFVAERAVTRRVGAGRPL